MKNYLNDFMTLAKYSDMANEMVASERNVYVIEGRDINGYDFHPTGNCGCIELNDEYMFGIRCDHFMWTEFWSEDDFNVILVYGNHKGELVSKLIIMYNGEDNCEYADIEYILKK